MIPKACKRLAEVDFPIAVVSRHAAREKFIRHGHPSTLHLWWARRPLASSRAMLLGLLLPDPCDPHCPEDFKKQARELLPRVQGTVGPADQDLQQALLTFIGDIANWDLATTPAYLEVGRAVVQAAHPDEPPLVVDPFAGGGSIPLEALRLGCEAFASDLNPVAGLILKLMLEDIPRCSHDRDPAGTENAEKRPQQDSLRSSCLRGESSLAENLRRVGRDIQEQAERELAECYPRDPDGATPIAYLWARTVRCEAPNCGAEIPLVRSFWLCKKPNRNVALRVVVHHRDTEGTENPEQNPPCSLGHRGAFPHVTFEIFEPKDESEVPEGTVSRARARCLCCGAVLPPERVRAQLVAQRGGADVLFHHSATASTEKNKKNDSVSSGSPWGRTGGARLLAVVTLKPGRSGRHYRLPTEDDYEAVWKAQQRLAAILAEWERGGRQGPCPVPDEPIHAEDTRNFWVCTYGPQTFGDLFTARQKLALVTLSRLVREGTANLQGTSKADQMRETIRAGMAMVVNRCADGGSSLSSWLPSREEVKHVFARQAIPMVWDFAEPYPLSQATRGFSSAVTWVAQVIERWSRSPIAHVQIADATEHPLPDASAAVWFTDPPYYDAVPYADLSDFFFVWLKRTLPGHPLVRDPFDPTNPLTPKSREAVQNKRSETDSGRPKDQAFYEDAMTNAFTEGRRVLRDDGIGAVVFAHKTTEGWVALLSGLIRGGWTITASWPIATEMTSRLRARESAALATSIHLVCRPRPDDASVGDWTDVLRELPTCVGDRMERLHMEGIRGADLVFACIGPALELFSRYAKVETTDGRTVTLAHYLEKVWNVIGHTALDTILGTAEPNAHHSSATELEEDARLTALILWILQSTNGGTIDHSDPESTKDYEAACEDDEGAVSSGSPWHTSGFSLPFDVARRCAQSLGIGLSKWEGRIIETTKGVVRLLSVSERTKQLLGKDGADTVIDRIAEAPPKRLRGGRGPDRDGSPQRCSGYDIRDEDSRRPPRLPRDNGATTLDRVHLAMLLQVGGHASALRTLLEVEQKRGSTFLRLANALSALYPKGSEEKRLLDALLLAMPR